MVSLTVASFVGAAENAEVFTRDDVSERIVVARALAPRPTSLIADEPISMLDVSIRAELLQLLDGLVLAHRLAMLSTSHDPLSARLIADDMLVLNHGRIVESGAVREGIGHPKDDYTRLLLDTIPGPCASTDAASD